jgi:dihydrofolate reductase
MRAIAAISRNGVIGRGNVIPWRIRDELAWFRSQTLGGVVVMGRRTFESLPKPLGGRLTVVLTSDPARLLADDVFRARCGDALAGMADHEAQDAAPWSLPGPPRTEVRVSRGIEALLQAPITERAWLCGGAAVYAQFLGRCTELLLSVVDREVEGDVLFPPFEHLFDLSGVAAEFPAFRVLRYVRNPARSGSGGRSL